MNKLKTTYLPVLTKATLAIVAAVVVVAFGLGVSPTNLFGAKAQPSCDAATENSDTSDFQLGYMSTLYQDQMRQLIAAPTTGIKVQTGPTKVGTIDSIAGDDVASVKSDSDSSSGTEVLTSRKLMESGLPLGWEAEIASGGVSQSVDYVVVFRYRSTVPAEIGASYRDGSGATISSETFSKLPVADQWTDKVLHIAMSPNGLTPSITISSDAVGSMSIQSLRIGQLPTRDMGKGLVSINFDDGWESAYTNGLPIFRKYGVVTTQYIVSGFSLGQHPLKEYMTSDQIKTLSRDGHEIASHSLSHCDARSLNDAKLSSSIKTSQQQFATKLGITPVLYAHPFGSYDDRVIADLSHDFSYIRSSDEGLNDSYFDPHNIKIMSVESDTTTSQIDQWVSQAATQHEWLVLVYHRIDESGEYNVTSQQLDSELHAITQHQGIRVVTMSEAIRHINSIK